MNLERKGMKMKAMMIQKYGGIEEFQEMEVDFPTVLENDVLIKIHATSVNPFDTGVREGGHTTWLPHAFPLALGWDVAGVVVAVGNNVIDFNIGDEVFSGSDPKRQGASAEYMVVDHRLVTPKPSKLTFEEAASIPAVGITAYGYLVDFANVKKDDKILIHGGAGGVGTFAIQLAKHLGAFVATTTSTKNIDLVRGLGADLVIDYTKENFTELVSNYDFVFDTVGGDVHINSYKVVKPSGTLMTIAGKYNEELAKERNITIGRPPYDPSREKLKKIAELFENGAIKPVVGQILPLRDIAKGHALSETGHARGKIVLKVC